MMWKPKRNLWEQLVLIVWYSDGPGYSQMKIIGHKKRKRQKVKIADWWLATICLQKGKYKKEKAAKK